MTTISTRSLLLAPVLLSLMVSAQSTAPVQLMPGTESVGAPSELPAGDCFVSVSPTSITLNANNSGTGSFFVHVDGCNNTYVAAFCEWVNVSVSGNTVSYTTSNNTSCSSRTCEISITNAASWVLATFTITQVGRPLPPQPGPISGLASFCESSQQQYTIESVSGASSYTWTYTGGGTPAGSGTSVLLTPTSSGTLRVAANNACGAGQQRTLPISFLEPVTAPLEILNTDLVCVDAPHLFVAQGATNATSYDWSYNGESLGTSTNTSFTTTLSEPGTLSVTAFNMCDTSEALSAEISLTTTPEALDVITGVSTFCYGSELLFSIDELPGASGYVWHIPTDWEGSSDSTSILVTTGSLSGEVQVAALNVCGAGPSSTLDVSPDASTAEPGPLQGPTTVCPNGEATYSVEPLPGAVSYLWTVPEGWSGASDSASITVRGIMEEGSIQLQVYDGCVNSATQRIDAQLSDPLLRPTAISGPQQPCTGEVVSYSVEDDDAAASYEWILPDASWAGTSTTSTIELTAGTVAGALRVRAVDQCGSSPERLRNLTIRSLPSVLPYVNGELTVCTGEEVVYHTLANSAVDYVWEMTGATESTVPTAVNSLAVTWTTAGEQTLSVSATNICGAGPALSLDVTVEDCTYISEALARGDLALYPNPAQGQVTLGWEQDLDITSAELRDAAGRLVRSLSLTLAERRSAGQLRVDVSDLEAGLYTILLKAYWGTHALHFVKE